MAELKKLSTSVKKGQGDHAKLHNEERRTINELIARVESLEADTSRSTTSD